MIYGRDSQPLIAFDSVAELRRQEDRSSVRLIRHMIREALADCRRYRDNGREFERRQNHAWIRSALAAIRGRHDGTPGDRVREARPRRLAAE